MTLVLLLPAILSFLLLAAHFLHNAGLLLTLLSLAMCPLLLVRRWWSLKLAQIVLILAALEWAFTAQAIIDERVRNGLEWRRAAIIILAVGAFNLIAAGLLQTRRLRARYARPIKDALTSSAG